MTKASDSDLGIEQQKDLVPTILELFGSKEFNPEKFE